MNSRATPGFTAATNMYYQLGDPQNHRRNRPLSRARRDRSRIAESQREYPSTIVNTGNCIGERVCPYPTGALIGGNHKSHCAISPAS
jgi:hypothetical protein